MIAPGPQTLAPTRSETPLERVLLAGVPTTKHARLVPLLRSPDRTVHGMALVLIQLDREAVAQR